MIFMTKISLVPAPLHRCCVCVVQSRGSGSSGSSASCVAECGADELARLMTLRGTDAVDRVDAVYGGLDALCRRLCADPVNGQRSISSLQHSSTLQRSTIWNSLPDSVISAPSLSTFRQRLKAFLFQASFPDIITDPR